MSLNYLTFSGPNPYIPSSVFAGISYTFEEAAAFRLKSLKISMMVVLGDHAKVLSLVWPSLLFLSLHSKSPFY